MKKYVLTGGPGIGKTTVVEILSSKGYKIVPESARIIIEEEHFKNSDILPWKNLEKFQTLVAQKQLEDEAKIEDDIVFLDRGIIDGHSFCLLGNVKTPELILKNAYNRYNKVFVLDQLDVYKNDAVRIESHEESKKIHQSIIESYQYFGYDIVFVPVLSPEDRAQFILENL